MEQRNTSSHIASNLGQRMFGGWVISGVILLIGVGFSYVFLRSDPLGPQLFVLLFPGMGLYLFYRVAKATRSLGRYGVARLSLSEAPHLGGPLRGWIHFDKGSGKTFCELHLECKEVPGGDDASKLLWENSARAAAGADGRIAFAFAIPGDLPPSTNVFKWRLSITPEENGFEQRFELDVAEAGVAAPFAPSQSASVAHETGVSVINAPQLSPGIVRIEKLGSAMRIEFMPARHRSMGIFLLVFGLIFGGVPLWMMLAGRPDDIVVYVMLSLFLVVGAATFVYGLYYLFNRCELLVVAAGARINRKGLFGKSEVDIEASKVRELKYAVSHSSGEGSGKRNYFKLGAVMQDDTEIFLGDGFDVAQDAEAVLDAIRLAWGMPTLPINGMTRLRHSDTSTGRSMPPRPADFKRVKQIKWAINIFALLFFIPFAWTFYKAFTDDREPAQAQRQTSRPESPDLTEPTADAWFSAMDANHLENLKAIAAKGFDIDTHAENGSTALMLSSSKGNLDIALWLIDQGADVNRRNTGGTGSNKDATPLMHAGFGGNPKLMAALLDAGAALPVQDAIGRTPLHTSAWSGCIECIRMLHERGELIDAKATGNRGETPLMIAASRNQIAAMDTLIELGANRVAVDSFGKTPYDWAEFFKQPDAMARLLSF